jgi:uncharacterized RDD family membrane protein YckC
MRRAGGGAVIAPATEHDPTDVLGRRAVAYVIDTIVVSAIGVAVFFATADATEIVDARDCAELDLSGTSRFCGQVGDTVYLFEWRGVLFASLAVLAWVLLVGWIAQGATGATLGKAITGIRTVDERGGGPGLGKQAVRGLLWVVPDGLLTCAGVPVVAALTAGFTRGHRRVGDMAARTFVVGRGDRGTPVVVPGLTAPPGGFAPPTPTAAPAATPFAAAPPTAPPAAAPVPEPPPTRAPAPAAEPGTPGVPPSGEAPAPQPTPGAAPTPSPEAPPEPAPGPPPPQPQWDEARQTYVVWDPARGTWLAHDRATDRWHPIP